MKILAALLFLFTFAAMAAVPTEEGLLKNLNNAGIPGNLITIKAMVQGSTLGNVTEGDANKADFYKFVLSLENPNAISLLQVDYSNSQMLGSQIKDVKYIPDLLTAIKREKSIDRGMFYSVLMMLATNRSQGVETFLEKSGIQVVKNKNVLNEEKMKLLRSYRTYLANNKGKGEANSPLNPPDPQNKAKVIELFRANTFERSKNIELVKQDNEFMWKVDWKSVQAYFTNEERRLRKMEYVNGDLSTKLEANDYILFNGTNELPKFITFKDSKGQISKLQILGLDTKTNREKKLSERYEEAKKVAPSAAGENFSFLF
jgi:hypothetical protein